MAEKENLTKTDLVKEALVEYLDKKEAAQSPYELGADLFGRYESGDSDRSAEYRTRIKEILRDKYTH
jgi:hypothetical protein